MKKSSLILTAAVLLATLAPVHIERSYDSLTKQERFALELAACREAQASNVPSKCKLFGKIQVVDNFPDVKIQKVDHFPDIKVKWVDHFPDDPGEWKKVDHFPDYKVQFVDHFPDYKVQFVDHFPGCD